MSNRIEPFTAQQRADIGRQVALARQLGTPWKELEQTFDRDRRQLYRYALDALMSQDLAGMSHLRPCKGPAAG